MTSAFGQIDPAAFALAIIGTVWAIEQGLAGFATNWLRRYNIKVLRTIQSSYDQTDLLRPLRRKNHDMAVPSCWHHHVPLCSTRQLFTGENPLLGLANVFYRLHVWEHDDPLQRPCGSWAFDLEWSELTVKMAIRELCNPDLFGDDLLAILYHVSQYKSGPFACKLPSDNNNNATHAAADGDQVSLAELLVTAFALYHMDGSQVIERRNIDVLGLATVTFEQAKSDSKSLVAVNLSIKEVMLQFSVNATAQCQQETSCASNAAYLIQYAAATGNRWLLMASLDRINHIVDVPGTDDLKNMAYAAGSGIALNGRGRTYTDIQNAHYDEWVRTNFIYQDDFPGANIMHYPEGVTAG
ncbi:unnamed protein product [Absidia cylindrospora]